MLIWINGAFGAGKSTVATALLEAIPDAMLYDPEEIGYLLHQLVPDSETGDFQDLPIWRTLVADTAVAMLRHYKRTLVVPMTLVNASYQQEIFDSIRARGYPIRAFSLIVSEVELRRRITAQVIHPDNESLDAATHTWRLDQVDHCVSALHDPALWAPISNENRLVSDIVAEILARVTAPVESPAPAPTVTFEWRGSFANDEVNALHAEAFETRVSSAEEWNWETQLARHSLGWVTARVGDELVGFVNVITDGESHAWLQDTMVASSAGRRLIALRQ